MFESETFGFPFSKENRQTWVLKCEKLTLENRREFIRYVTKIVHEWNGHPEIFSLPQAIENSRQFLGLRTDILQKTVVGCPWCYCLESPFNLNQPCTGNLERVTLDFSIISVPCARQMQGKLPQGVPYGTVRGHDQG